MLQKRILTVWTQRSKGSDQEAHREVIILRWPYLPLTPAPQRQAAVGRVTLQLQSSQSPSVSRLTAPCQAHAPAEGHTIMASQPAIMATPPTGASLPRAGSPVRAWWYRGPQNIPMPAIRTAPAWGGGGSVYSPFGIWRASSEALWNLNLSETFTRDLLNHFNLFEHVLIYFYLLGFCFIFRFCLTNPSFLSYFLPNFRF